MLLLHGAGGATHSFRHLAPLLLGYRVIMIDLPGQGFTRMGAKRCGVDAMAADIATLCNAQNWQIHAIIGHSAGAAIALRMAETMPLAGVIGINAALGKFEGASGWIFPIMARLLAMTPFVAQLFSKIAATPRQVHSLLTSTGSRIDAAGEAQYLHLMQMPSHVGATLAMMAQWNLDGLINRLPQQTTPCLLITGDKDLAVPPKISEQATERMQRGKWISLPGFGHLVQEEAAEAVAAPILAFLNTLPAAQ